MAQRSLVLLASTSLLVSLQLSLSSAEASTAAIQTVSTPGGDTQSAARVTSGSAGLSAGVKPDNSGSKVEEIVVTAQKRTENLQKVPLSVQVISGQALGEKNYNSFGDVSQIVPAVHVSAVGADSQLYIRGIGSGDNSSFDQSVAIFNDDIYNGRSRLSGATFLDLARIEVLKGPQSTFFGNSAIAGALNIVTQKPGSTFDASGRLLYGSYGQYAAEGALTVPVSDTLSTRLALTANGERGWIKNVNTGEKAPHQNNFAGRLTVLWRPSDKFDATLKVEGSKNNTSGTPGGLPSQRVNCPPPAPLAIGFVQGCGQALALGTSVPIGLDNNQNTGLAGQGAHLATYDVELTANYHLGEHTLTSVTGYLDYDFISRYSQILPVVYQQITTPEQYHQFSQEVRITSPSDRNLTYLAGFYYQRDRLATQQEDNAPFLNFVATFPGFGALAPYLPFAIVTPFVQNDHVYSAFGSASYNLTNRLKLNAGVRQVWEDKSGSGSNLFGTSSQVYGGFQNVPPLVSYLWSLAAGQGIGGPSPTKNNSYQGFTPSAGVQYQATADAMAYFKYNRGFKSGGFNGVQFIAFPQFAAYGPEHVNAYELGLKSKFFNSSLLFNIDIFRSDYEALQVNAPFYVPQFNAYEAVVKNAAASRAQGVELETEWAATRNLRFSANVTYLESTYTSFPNSSPSTLQNGCANKYVVPTCSVFPKPVSAIADVTGQSTPYAPKWSGSVTASYAYTLPRDYRLRLQLSPYFTTGYYSDGANGNDSFFRVPGYIRLDATLTLETPDRRWAVDIIGKNITDRTIVSYASLVSAPKEEPANIAVQIRAKF